MVILYYITERKLLLNSEQDKNGIGQHIRLRENDDLTLASSGHKEKAAIF